VGKLRGMGDWVEWGEEYEEMGSNERGWERGGREG